VETRPSVFSMGSEGIILVPNPDLNEIKGDSINLNDYSTEAIRVSSGIHTHTMSFGQEGVANAGDYSMATFEITYRTNGWAAFCRFVLPWMAVMVILLLATNL
jgi:hypothetical protein